MLKQKNKQLVLGIVFLLFGFVHQAMAQETEKQSLQQILETLETRFDVRFTYPSEEIKILTIEAPKNELSLTQAIVYITEKTGLIFNKINARYFTIVSKNENSRCGKVVSMDTGEVLAAATIQVIDGSFSTVTNDQGIFYIPKNISEKNILIRHIGLTEIILPISQLSNDCTPIYLQTETTRLETVLLKSYLVKGIDKEQNSAITINTENFGLLPGQIENDVLQIAQALPGVESVDETISNINIRGGTHAENLILWENIRMYQSGHFFGLISAFNPDITNTVTVYKNGTPARYSEGVSGVIDMRADSKIPDKTSGSGGVNLLNASAYVAIPLSETLGIQVAGRKSLNSLLETPVYDTYSKRIFQDTEIEDNETSSNEIIADEDFSFYDLSTNVLWKPSEKDHFSLNFLTIDNTLDFTETITNTSVSKTSELNQRSIAGGISWNHIWNDMISTRAFGFISYYLLKSNNKNVFTTQELFQENEVLENGAKIETEIKLSQQFKIDAGYHFTETGISNTQDVNLPRFRDFEKEVLRTHGLFASGAFASENKKTHMNAGVRVNYFAKFKEISVEPRISINQKLGAGFSIETLGEVKTQTTTQRIDFESDFLGVEKRRWVLANNEDIPITESKQVSLGVSYNKNRWFITLDGFYKWVDNISAINQGFQNQFQFSRAIGGYNVKGIEAVLNKKTDHFSGWISYAFTKNDYEFSTLQPSKFSNNLDIRHAATVAASYTVNHLKLATGLNFHSGKPYTVPLPDDSQSVDPQDPINFAAPNAERLSSYTRIDFSAEYIWEFSNGVNAKINFAILNVLNAENVLNKRYARIEEDNGQANIREIEEVSLGFTPNASIQVLF